MSVVLRSEVEREIRNMLEEGEAKSLLPGLAARLRSNSECAPWVVEAVKELEGERATLLRCVRVLLGDLDCLREALEDKNHAALLGYPRPDKEPKSWADQEHERLRKRDEVLREQAKRAPGPYPEDTEPRSKGCECHLEVGDSPCPVHGETDE